MTNLAITFQGRKTARESSEQRRLAILKAALRVVVRDGVRGVRHRAVAQEAGVPLSATTYYFKDIHDLLTDAFTLFAKETLETLVDPFWLSLQSLMAAYSLEEIRGNQSLADELFVRVADAGADYICGRVSEHREQLTIEYAFWYAALQDEHMQPLAVQHGQRLVRNMLPFLEQVGVREPELAAKSIIATVRRLEYEALLTGVDSSYIRQAMLHQIRAVVGS